MTPQKESAQGRETKGAHQYKHHDFNGYHAAREAPQTPAPGTKGRAALDYAAKGWPVFPLVDGGKIPRTGHGVKDASTDPATVAAWWQEWPDANIGLAVPPGLVAVDLDVKNGQNGIVTLDAIAEQNGGLPETLTAETTTGGRHLFYGKPEELEVKNRAGLRPGVDCRADRGYVVAAPSVIGGKCYRWMNDAPIVPAPAWLLDVLTEDVKPEAPARAAFQPTVTPARGDKYAERALESALAHVAKASEGARNDTLNREAHGLARLAAAGRLDWGSVEAALLHVAESNGLSESEARKTLKSAHGAATPNYTGQHDGAAVIELPGEWAEPEPLPDALPAVAPFEAELLPDALRGWVVDIAERMQCPSDFPAVGALVALSAVVGARAVIAPKERDDWRVVPNLWGVVVGRPGVMKSPALSQALTPLHRLESAERERWEKVHAEWEIECKLAELQAKQNEKKAAGMVGKDKAKARELLQPAELPDEPTMRRYVVNDSTQEKLAGLLTVNPWGLLVNRDELHGLLCSMDREGQEGARSFYLTGYDGNQGYAVDRIGRGESYVPRVCLALLGGIQPARLQSYVRDAVRGGRGDDGLLQRFGLAVWPDVSGDFRKVDRWPDTEAKQRAWAVFERLAALQPVNDAEPVVWRFTPEAQALYWEWAEPFERELRGAELHPALVSHLAKYRKLVPALALIFALVDTPEAGAVGERELARALDWQEYLRTHAERLYAAATISETAGAETLLAKVQARKLCDADGVLLEGFTPRQVAVKHWAGLATPDEARKAADLLAEYGWLRADAVPTGAAGGRPSERYTLHPALLKEAVA